MKKNIILKQKLLKNFLIFKSAKNDYIQKNKI